MAQGTIKWYDPAKGFGFIIPDGGGGDVFVQREALLGDEPLPGDRVTFVQEGAVSGPVAKQVQNLSASGGSAATPEDRPSEEHIVVPVHEEQLTATTHEVTLGDVLIHTHTETEPVSTMIDLSHDELSAERVPVNQPVDVVPEVRYEDDVIIVPIVAEEVVLTKRLVLKEELHIRRRRVTERTPIEDTVRRQVVDVEGRPAPGVTPTVEPIPDQEATDRRPIGKDE